ncbi:MAG: arginase [Azonexus sp.]|uniref:arginase n=1 Tax=Azonexus sp. TaxID=1872668 RepID=UPI0028287426|nr:arginase [Azonexus sp.]MDR0775454.1 arginase [Azonexus sp.]
MSGKIRIVGAASGLGAQDRGCADGPVAFHRSQAWHELQGHPRLDWGPLLFAADAQAGSEMARIASFCRRLADEVTRVRLAGDFPLIIGGDHSIAVGTWSGVARSVGAPLGLLWIDAHLDSHTPQTSYSGAVHGMPLACLLGRGDKRLLKLGLAGVQISAAHTVALGPRSYEAEEMAFLRAQGVRIIDSGEIAARGFAACLHEAQTIVAAAPAGFGLTLDLDVIDPDNAPGVGSPEPDGLWDGDVLAALARLATLPGLLAVEIAEYNPDRDRQGRTARLMAELISEMLPGLVDRFQG